MNFIVWSRSCFYAFYSIRSNFRKWFVSQNMDSLSLRSTSQGVLNARVMINMLETEESISEIDGHHILQEVSELRSFTELNGVLPIWAHKHVGKYMVCVNNSCLQVRFCCNTTFRGFIELQSRNFISDYERSIRIGTIISGGFVNTSVSKSWTISVTCFNIFFLIHRFRPKISRLVSREFWC